MDARTAALLGVVALLGLAGCAGVLPGDAGESDVTFPAGTSPDGVTNASTLLSTHQDRLAADSYRIRYDLLYGQAGGSTGNSTTVVASNATQERQRYDNDLPGRQVDTFVSGNRSFSRIRVGNQTTYNAQPLAGNFDAFHADGARPGQLLETVVAAGNYTYNDTETRDGRTLLTFQSETPVANASGQLPAEIQTFNATVRVDQDGRVWRADLFATGQTNGTEQVFHQEYRTLETGGVTVPRPGWVDQAAEG